MTGNKIIDEHVDLDNMELISKIIEAGELLDNQKVPTENRWGPDTNGNIAQITDKYGEPL